MEKIVGIYQKYCSKILRLTYSVVGFFIFVFLFHSANYVNAANNAPVAPTSTSAINTSTIQYNWASGGGSETYYTVDQSTDGSSYTFVATTTQTYYLFSNLAPNTRYWFRVASGDGVGATSTYVTSSPKYTLANRVTLTVVSVTTSSITFLADYPTSNPSTTLYRVGTILEYYDSSGSPTSTNDLFYSSSTWGSPITVNGVTVPISGGTTLSMNAKNGDGTVGGSNNISVLFRPYVPLSVSLNDASVNSLKLNFSSDLNVSGIFYRIYNQTLGNYIDQDGYATSTFFQQASSTWGNNIELKGLSANTAYQFYVIAHNGGDLDYDTSATSSLSSALYTLASTPSVTAVSRPGSQATLVWSGDAAAYMIENITTGQSSGWISEKTYSFSGLSCGVSYFFKVKGRNGDGVETNYSQVVVANNVSCGGGGGGGGLTISLPSIDNPQVPGVSIESVVFGRVVLKFNIRNAAQVGIAQDAQFSDVVWSGFQNTATYTLSAKNKNLTLYIKFRSVESGESAVFKVDVPSSYSTVSSNQNLNSENTTATSTTSTLNQFADLIFVKIPSTNSFKRLQTIKFTYTYTNNSSTSQTIKTVRSLWVNTGKEKKLSQVYGFRTLKPGKSFSVPVSQYLSKTLPFGNYSIRVEILDSKGKVVKARNSFDFEIKK